MVLSELNEDAGRRRARDSGFCLQDASGMMEAVAYDTLTRHPGAARLFAARRLLVRLPPFAGAPRYLQ